MRPLYLAYRMTKNVLTTRTFLESKHLSVRFVELKQKKKIGMYSIVLLIILYVLKIFTSHKITARSYRSSIVEITTIYQINSLQITNIYCRIVTTFIFDALKTIS